MASIHSSHNSELGARLPVLPTEIWLEIFSHLEYQHPSTAQPSWEPWLVYRSVDRHFKALVEIEYVRRYLRECAIVLDTGLDDDCCARSDWTGGMIGSSRSLRYDFAGFSGTGDVAGNAIEWDRFALFRCKLGNALETASIAQTQALDQPPQHNYHPNILMQLGTGATDLLPSDLQFVSSSNDPTNSWTFKFDWRRYFGTLFGEVKHAAAFRDKCWQKKVKTDLFLAEDEKDDSNCWRGQSLVRLATSLYRQAEEKRAMLEHMPLIAATDDLSQADWPSSIDSHTSPISPVTALTPATLTSTFRSNSAASSSSSDDDEDLLSPHAQAQLILAAGTYDVGVDGRYREVRRQRRRRVWNRLQQRKPSTDVRDLRIQGAADCENEEYRRQRMVFERVGEGRMARKLLMLQAQIAGRRGVIEW